MDQDAALNPIGMVLPLKDSDRQPLVGRERPVSGNHFLPIIRPLHRPKDRLEIPLYSPATFPAVSRQSHGLQEREAAYDMLLAKLCHVMLSCAAEAGLQHQ